MRHIGPKLHRFIYGLWRKSDDQEVRYLHDRIRTLLRAQNLLDPMGRTKFAQEIADDVAATLLSNDTNQIFEFVCKLMDYEQLFNLPDVDFGETRSVSQYWELKDQLNLVKDEIEKFDKIKDLITSLTLGVFAPIQNAIGVDKSSSDRKDGISLPTPRADRMANLDEIVERIIHETFTEEIETLKLLPRLRNRLEKNLVVASGGNPRDLEGFKRQYKMPPSYDAKSNDDLIATYLGGTPYLKLFEGVEDFTIPLSSRFEHHHIIAGTGHGKTQTLQFLIANDLEAVKRGERSIVVIDSQGDLIGKLRRLAEFAPGGELHDRICIIDPSDLEYPVSLNLFDVGQDRLENYGPLERERLSNSILELYDFVLGSLLSAEMTQKQEVLFNFVTRLMLVMPNATIYTLRNLFEAKDTTDFIEHVNKLDGTAKHFFLTEFKDKEFHATKAQVRRRLLGILGNRTFERMFANPKSKLDLFSEMNSGKVILINTAKDLLKASGTEIFGRFFIALIAQAAQERAMIAEKDRMPTFVYIDEAADYFDQNIEVILREARKYKVGMILAHQYLGQLSPKLQEAFSANTVVKFAGGVSAKDARTLAQQLSCDASLIESQGKLSFATHIRGLTKTALPLQFSYGIVEQMEKMTKNEEIELRDLMREKYAEKSVDSNNDEDVKAPLEYPKDVNPDTPDTSSNNQW